MRIKHSISIVACDNYANKDNTNTSYIRIRVSYRGKRIDLSSGISVAKSQWNDSRQRVKQGCTVGGIQYNIINDLLNSQEDFVHTYFNDAINREQEPNLQELKKRFNNRFKSSATQNANEFYSIFDEYIERRSHDWGDDIKGKFLRLRARLYRFNPNLGFNGLTEQFMYNLIEDMSKDMFNDSIIKQLAYLKQVVDFAKARNYYIHNEYYTFKCKLPKSQKAVRYLEVEDINAIAQLDLPLGGHLDKVRDFFLFQCLTALRDSDIRQLKHDDITRNAQGEYHVQILTQKDNDRISFKLTRLATKIYLKYKDNIYDNGVVFPMMSNQKYNEALKQLGKVANLQGEWTDYQYRLHERVTVKIPKQDLTTHTARRTFVVIALNEKIPLELIALITSHSDFNAMKPYIKANHKGISSVVDTVDNVVGDDYKFHFGYK